MKVVIALLLPSAILASILQPQKETYASYAKRNGIAIPEAKTRSGASAQYADCWDYNGQQGYTRRINDYVANLGTDSNRFSSCCFYGIWLMYDDINYNQNNNNVSKIQWRKSKRAPVTWKGFMYLLPLLGRRL